MKFESFANRASVRTGQELFEHLSLYVFFFQEAHPEGQHHVSSQLHRVLQGIQTIPLRAEHVCRERVWCCHDSQHAGAGKTLILPPAEHTSSTGFTCSPFSSVVFWFSGCGSDVGEATLPDTFTDQYHLQDFQRGALPEQDGRGADVGLWERTGWFPQ